MATLKYLESAKSLHRSDTTKNTHLFKEHGRVAATASIPSKYQTIVIRNNEKTAFNSGAKRFVTSFQEDSPSPSTYNVSRLLCQDNHVSHSKKGVGGFVSKAKRFPQYPGKEASVGPCQYYPNVQTTTDFNRASCTSNFHKPFALQRTERKFITPAPNHYNVSSNVLGKVTRQNNVAACAAFLSKSKRDTMKSNLVPAPGTYTINDKMIIPSPRAAQAPFKSTLIRELPVSKSLLESPGPAAYYPHETKSAPTKRGFARKHYLCISAPAVPLPLQPETPGPGQYNLVDYDGPSRQFISSSMFVSTANRWNDNNKSVGPGPAAYDPQGISKKSFVFNPKKKWI